MTIGQRIQELRKSAGLSQEGLGEALGVSRQAVSKWEGDNGIPELDTLIAMSRLFGVTVGQLLGVEGPAQAPEEPADSISEDRVEAILRRYVEESRQHETPKKRLTWLWPLGACCVLLAAVIVLFVQIKKLEKNTGNLWGSVSSMNSTMQNVRNQIGSLSGELRDILEEQSSLLSTFDCQVVDFDLEAQTVDLELSATLKAYSAGETAQFCLYWIENDQTEGTAATEPVDGPEFKAHITIPMNFHLEVSVRFAGADGTVREQQTDTIYSGMNPGEFSLQGVALGSWWVPETGSIGYHVQLHSYWPERIYPVSAQIVVLRNGEEIWRKEETVDRQTLFFEGTAEVDPFSKEDAMELWCYVTDNYGRVTELELPGADGTGGSYTEVRPE